MICLSRFQLEQDKSYSWSAYFEENNKHRLQIDFSKETELSEKERKLIFPSIQWFQKGEASDGAYLLKCAKQYAEKNHNLEYFKAIQWFICEENRHSWYLKQFMNFYQVSECKKSVLDNIFRRLRKINGLKSEIIVLVTAEMIALSYYSALAECSTSLALKSICRQMLKDELRHIVFQSNTLYQLKITPLENLLRIFLMELTILAVWAAMKEVFLAGGYSFRRFAADSLGYLRQSIQMTKGKLAQ